VIETLARTYLVWKPPIAYLIGTKSSAYRINNCGFRGEKTLWQRFPLTNLEKPANLGFMPRNSAALIDDVSKSIIEQLQSDGRKPYASIGKSIGLSEAAVRQRVQKLLDSNVMQVVAVTDPLQVGFKRAAMIGVNVEGDIEKVADALAKLEEVNYVVVCAGGFDILIEVVCEDDEKLLSILNKRIRAIPGVDSTEAFVYLKIRKQTYSWGTK
jgi:Lrp/AsnC family transcriptional regulator for asnA, asnC and gidA